MKSSRPAPPVRRAAGDQNSVRLIAGRWRGRKVRFPDGEGLRPTPSRVRETLFNWLMHAVRDARVLDLYAGSGALAFEALSRGAREAVLVDASAQVCAQLKQELAALTGASGRILREDAARFLARTPDAPFDIVFLDPPFHRNLLPACMQALETQGFLAPGAHVYVESESAPAAGSVPANWQLHRQQEAGQVCYSLYIRQPA